MKPGIPAFTGISSGNKWEVLQFCKADPFILVHLLGYNGEERHKNSEGWEKYEIYFHLTLLFKDLHRLSVKPWDIEKIIESKSIDSSTIFQWYNELLCEAYYDIEERLIDFY